MAISPQRPMAQTAAKVTSRKSSSGLALESGPYETVSLLTGPEGGLEEKEVQQALDAGLQVCTLGKRILRCETAPLCALSAVMYDAGEF